MPLEGLSKRAAKRAAKKTGGKPQRQGGPAAPAVPAVGNAAKLRAAKAAADKAKFIASKIGLSKEQQVEQGLASGGYEGEVDWETLKIKGTCTTVEKEFLRLTGPPDPATVRPEPILRLALAGLKAKWKSGCSYRHAKSQLKAIRQDLVVQLIRSDLTVEAYEVCARIALEKNDRTEFNQCQTQLILLYQEGLTGSYYEFLAYRILYYVYNGSVLDSTYLLASLTEEDLSHPDVLHATQVMAAATSGNYARFFRLYTTAPNMGAYVMDYATHAMRIKALTFMARGFRPNVALSFVRDLLLFDDDEECVAFIQAAGGVVEGWTGPAGETGASTTAPSPTPGPDGAAKPCVWNTVASKIESFKQVVPEPEEDEPE